MRWLNMNDIAINVGNVSKTYRDIKAVSDLSFNVEASSCFGFLGPNGAGKTTMMKILYAKAKRDQNPPSRVSVFGFDPERNELEIKHMSGIVPQDNNLDEELSVLQNLLVYSKFYGLSKKTVLPRIEYLLDFMELGQKKKSKISELSGGMKRRLVIARALLNNPRLLILDEPTTGLDPQVRHLIWDKLFSLKKGGVTILVTTHYMEEAFQICDRLMIMHLGEKVLEGKPQQLISEKIESFVLEVLAGEARLDKIELGEVRKEVLDHRVLLYSQRIEDLQTVTRSLNPGEYHLRQSNLEDLFLKTTGRRLSE
jgi:lipooligosaccharide transport system ATP-binding protein